MPKASGKEAGKETGMKPKGSGCTGIMTSSAPTEWSGCSARFISGRTGTFSSIVETGDEPLTVRDLRGVFTRVSDDP